MGDMSVADALLLNDRKDCNYGFGGSWMWIIFLFFIFGWGGNGFNRGAEMEGMAIRNAVTEGFNFNQLDNGIRSVQSGICDSTYALKSAIDNCCCQTQRSIDGVKYEMSKGFCDVVTANNLNTRDILQNQNAGVQKILDYMYANEKQALRDRIQTLETSGIIQAQTRNLVDTLRPCPIPAYITCSPYQTANYGYGCGCGVYNGYGI